MIANIWIAHILAFHLSVPESVNFQIVSLWPSENKAQIQLVNNTKWELKYDKFYWRTHSESTRKFVIAHELCHTVYEYNVQWDKISKKERNIRHKFVNQCAKKIIRDHKENCK